MKDTEGTLVLSLNRGRYAIGDPEDGADLTSGDRVEVKLGGQWIAGHVENSARYAHEDYRAPSSKEAYISGYYFIADNGGICGLCCGIRVRTR